MVGERKFKSVFEPLEKEDKEPIFTKMMEKYSFPLTKRPGVSNYHRRNPVLDLIFCHNLLSYYYEMPIINLDTYNHCERCPTSFTKFPPPELLPFNNTEKMEKFEKHWPVIGKSVLCLSLDLRPKICERFKVLIDNFHKRSRELAYIEAESRKVNVMRIEQRNRFKASIKHNEDICLRKELIICKLIDIHWRSIHKKIIFSGYLDEKKEMRFDKIRTYWKQTKDNLRSTLREVDCTINKELYAHVEKSVYLEKNTWQYEHRQRRWRRRFAKDFEQLEIQVYVVTEKVEEIEKSFKELEENYHSHEIAIQNYLAHKKAKEERIELEIKLNYMATRIQAWWRGMMVRHKLGPYNPKRKGKAKGKANKKKK